jgi:hypothetical protein
MEKFHIKCFDYFAELSTRLKLVEENNNVLLKQIQDYKSFQDDNVRIIHEKQKLVSLFFLREYNIHDFIFLFYCRLRNKI